MFDQENPSGGSESDAKTQDGGEGGGQRRRRRRRSRRPAGGGGGGGGQAEASQRNGRQQSAGGEGGSGGNGQGGGAGRRGRGRGRGRGAGQGQGQQGSGRAQGSRRQGGGQGGGGQGGGGGRGGEQRRSRGGGQGNQGPGQGHGQGHGQGRNKNRRRRRTSGEGGGGGGGAPVSRDPIAAAGVIELERDGKGYIRKRENDYSVKPGDVMVPGALVRQHRLVTGNFIEGMANPGGGNRPATLTSITSIDGFDPDAPELARRRPFKILTSLDPIEKFQLSKNTTDPTLRLLDLLTPIGKGQRGLIVAPPRTGKTMLLQRVAHAITENHPEVHLIALLVDERPEEATEWKRSVRGEVLTSTSDELAANHVNIAEIVIERAKRLVELGTDVVILFDSLTRLARAYNLETKNSGRTLTGGVDAKTLERPKSFFGAARNAEEGGSLTMIATALIETGSRMDQVIFEEFKGTGNMELVLSRKLADLRVFPAMDIHLSGTRKEEKLLSPEMLRSSQALRRVLHKVDPVQGMQILIQKVSETESNEAFLSMFQGV